MRRRPLLGLLPALAAAPALAQSDWQHQAVPFYTPADVLSGLYRHHLLPRARAFDAAAAGLAQALQGGDRAAQRQAWLQAMLAWEALNAVAVGPLLARRSARAIDFQPTRPRLIEAALKQGPPWDPVRIGAPAKGLPALEWLLWTVPEMPSHGAGYAALLAQEIRGEAAALVRETEALAAHAWGEDDGPAAVAEFVNQWVGGLEQLRWGAMAKPQRAGRPQDYPRATSDATAKAWAARWAALRALTLAGAGSAPAPAQGLVPLETWLRGRGLNAQADALRQAAIQADAALAGLNPAGDVAAAVDALAALQRLAEERVAPALDVRLGFSSSDGD